MCTPTTGKPWWCPILRGQRCEVAIKRLQQLGLHAEVTDTGYNATIAADAILDQNVPPGGLRET